MFKWFWAIFSLGAPDNGVTLASGDGLLLLLKVEKIWYFIISNKWKHSQESHVYKSSRVVHNYDNNDGDRRATDLLRFHKW